MYIPVSFQTMLVPGLVDKGSSINDINKNLFNSISCKLKLSFEQLDNPIIPLANDAKIKVFGTTKIKSNPQRRANIRIPYHPLILRIEYLNNNHKIIDFSYYTFGEQQICIHTHKKLTIEPNSELLTYCKVPNHLTIDIQGVLHVRITNMY